MHSPALFLAGLTLLAATTTGCTKKEEPAASGAQPGSTLNIGVSQGGGAMAAPESDATRYSDEGPEIGTVVVRRVSIARRSADQSSEILMRIGTGTAVNKKARKGPYYLVEFPSTTGQMRLGWVAQDDINVTPPAVTTTAPTATAVPTATSGSRPPPVIIKRPPTT